jgi:hypothetical protein
MDYYNWNKLDRVDSKAKTKINARVRADERAQGVQYGRNVRKTSRRNTTAAGGSQEVSQLDQRATGTGTP